MSSLPRRECVSSLTARSVAGEAQKIEADESREDATDPCVGGGDASCPAHRRAQGSALGASVIGAPDAKRRDLAPTTKSFTMEPEGRVV